MSDDEAEFTRWALSARPRLIRTAVLLSGDLARAEDVVQEALTQVAARWSRLRDGNPDAYARRCVVTGDVSWWRRRRHEVVRDLDLGKDDEPVTASGSEQVERRLVLDQALARLTPRQRAVVVLRYYDDLSERDVAETLGVSVGTVKSQTHLALRRMREAVPAMADLLGDLR